MKYANLLEVAKAVFDGRVQYLHYYDIGKKLEGNLHYFCGPGQKAFPGYGMANNGHRMWFCLFVWEATK